MRIQDDLFACLRETLGQGPSPWLDSSSGEWSFASKPYNVRLANATDPLAIAYPNTLQDIASCLKCAQRARVPVVARSGGHSYAAYSLGGAITSAKQERSLVVDMHSFNELDYHPASQIATVGSGVLLGTMNEFLEAHGRMLPTGSCPTVGVGGQVLAGGFGLSSRSAGLFLDNLVEMDVVLADGTVHTVSEGHMADLYWGMRGAGASLAIAHTFRLRTHPAPTEVIYYELTLLPRSLDASSSSVDRATRFYEAFEAFGGSALATAELGMFAWHVTPEQEAGGAGWGTKVEVLGQYMGDQAGFDRVIGGFERILRDMGENNYHLGSRRLSFLESMHQVGGNWTRLADRGRLNINEHVHFYAKSLLTKRPIARDNIHAHLSYLLHLSPLVNRDNDIEWFVLSPFLGGQHSAITKPSPNTTAFAHRDLRVVWELYAKTLNEEMESPVDLVPFVGRMAKDLGTPEAVYPAYVDAEISERDYARLIWGENYRRLQSVKAKYDPADLFRYPQSVKLPSSSTGSLVALAILCALVLFLLRRVASNRRKSKPRTRVD